MDPPEIELADRWRELCADLTPEVRLPASLGRELVERYQERHRHYHTDRHLLAVLRSLDELSAPDPASPETRLAAWFHDAIYAGIAGEDEEASARLAEDHLSRSGMDPAIVEQVASMVRATARHLDPGVEHDEATARFLDADLSILATDRTEYDAYCRAVRLEHPQVPDDRFVTGRLAVVTALLARPRLYLTAGAAERYEAPARANLRREQDALSARAGAAPPPR